MSNLYDFDKEYINKGIRVVGVDEAGRGPLAGPVVASAVILKEKIKEEDLLQLFQINDSKKLSEKKREKLYEVVKENFYVGIGIATHTEIDEINILNGTFLAMRRALEALSSEGFDLNEYTILIDGNHKIRECNYLQESIIKGDSKSLSIAAASIIAKVTRDEIMKELTKEYGEYDFHKHKGYGTKLHREKLLEIGPSPIHRRSFLKKILG